MRVTFLFACFYDSRIGTLFHLSTSTLWRLVRKSWRKH
jgi:hypothetical protein